MKVLSVNLTAWTVALCLLKSYPHASGEVEERNNNEVSDDLIMDVKSNIIPEEAKFIRGPNIAQDQKLGIPISIIRSWFNSQLEQKAEDVAVFKNQNFPHVVDHKFGSALVQMLKENHIASVTDLGCGTGAYVKMIAESNIEVQGFDGNPETKTLERSGGLCVG